MSTITLLNGLYRRENPVQTFRMRRIFAVLIAVLALTLVLELIFHLVISPRLRLTKVEISADRGLLLSDAGILKLAGISGDEYFFAIDEVEVRARITAYAPIKSATVKKIFPNALKISLEQRTPLAICLAVVDGRTVPVALDEEGVVFQIGATVRNLDMPVLSGLTFNRVELGQRVNRALLGYLEDLRKLEMSSLVLLNLISEIKFVTKNRSTFEVLLYPRDYRVAIRTGPRINADMVREMLLVLDVFDNQGVIQNLAEIDFRTDVPMVRFKEE